MPTENAFISPQTPSMWTAVCTTAETAFHAPTNVQVLINETTETSAHRVSGLYAITRAAIASATVCQLYKKVGTTYTLIASVLMATGTPSATVAPQSIDFGYTEDNPLILTAGVGLAVAISQGITNGVVFKAQGGIY